MTATAAVGKRWRSKSRRTVARSTGVGSQSRPQRPRLTGNRPRRASRTRRRQGGEAVRYGDRRRRRRQRLRRPRDGDDGGDGAATVA